MQVNVDVSNPRTISSRQVTRDPAVGDPDRKSYVPRAPNELIEGARPGSDVSPTRLMVIDDLAEIRELLRDYLESKGYAVETAENAADALIRLGQFRPRVILLDILMPGLSGISALERIRRLHPEVEVIMVTGIGDEETAKRALAMGAFDYVSKPIDFAYLMSAIETCLLMRPLPPPD